MVLGLAGHLGLQRTHPQGILPQRLRNHKTRRDTLRDSAGFCGFRRNDANGDRGLGTLVL